MNHSNVKLTNKSSNPIQLHLEPECAPFTIPPGMTLSIQAKHPGTICDIWFTDDSEYAFFGAIHPESDDLVIEIEGSDEKSNV